MLGVGSLNSCLVGTSAWVTFSLSRSPLRVPRPFSQPRPHVSLPFDLDLRIEAVCGRCGPAIICIALGGAAFDSSKSFSPSH